MKILIKDFMLSFKKENDHIVIQLPFSVGYDRETDVVDIKIVDMDYKACGHLFGYDGIVVDTIEEEVLTTLRIIKLDTETEGEFILTAALVKKEVTILPDEASKLLNSFGFLQENKQQILNSINAKEAAPEPLGDKAEGIKDALKAFAKHFGPFKKPL